MKVSKMQNKISYLQLFKELFLINTFTFGGGYTIIPIIKDKFVNELNLFTNEEMENFISLAASVPGVLAISTSYLVGYRLKGYRGGIVAVLASISPCVIIISFISVIYIKFIKNIYVLSTLKSISAMVSAILFVSVFKMIKNIDKKYYILMVIFAIIAYFKFLNLITILIIAGIIGFFTGGRK